MRTLAHRNTLVFVLAATLTFCANGMADLPFCGYVVSLQCPICTPNNPAGGCYCGPESGACWCRKTTGGVQDGIRVVCETGDFNVTSDPNGLVLSEGPEALCSTAYKCMLASGSQVNSATYVAGTCVPTGQDTCDWRLFGTPVMQPTYVQGGRCPH